MNTLQFLGKPISGCFTLPSGVITTNAKIIETVAREIPQIGVITTKSIGLLPRDGHREPPRLDVAQQLDECPFLGEVRGGNHDRCQGGDAQQPGQPVA